MIRRSLIRASCTDNVACSALALLLLFWPNTAEAQKIDSSLVGGAVPTLESLPHAALPRGVFMGWCGQNDRYLLNVDGALEAYDAGVKFASIAVSSDWPWQCDKDGEQLVYINTQMGYVTKVDIASGDSRLLASYQQPKLTSTTVSFSPDMRTVATTVPLNLTADARELKVLSVPNASRRNSKEHVEKIKWKEDASRLLVVFKTSVEIVDAGGALIDSGNRPGAETFSDGWFDDGQQALTLFLGRNEIESGFVIRCLIAPWKCNRLRSRVDSVSLGRRGIMGTIQPLGKKRIADDDSIPIYDRYAAEIRNRSSVLLARQVYSTSSGQWPFDISVSPSGTKAILTWSDRRLPGCGPGHDSFKCAQGISINLSKVLR